HRHLHPFVLRGIVVGSLHDHRLARQPDIALLVDADHLDGDLVALLEHVGDLTHPVRSDLADVQQAVRSRHDLDEGAVSLDPPYLAGVGLADLRYLGEVLDHLDGEPGRPLVGRGDDDLAVVLDLDVAAGLLNDRADGLATGSDDIADLLLRDLNGVEPRRELGHLHARLGQDLLHDVQDVHASGPRLLQSHLHDLAGDAGDLDVHLQGGHAL